TDSAQADSVWGPKAQQFCTQSGGACPVFDNEGVLYGQHKLSTETAASVSGGTEGTQYFLSGLVKHDAGVAANTGYQKQSFRANLDQTFTQRLHVSFNTQLVHSISDRGISNNDNTGTSTY